MCMVDWLCAVSECTPDIPINSAAVRWAQGGGCKSSCAEAIQCPAGMAE